MLLLFLQVLNFSLYKTQWETKLLLRKMKECTKANKKYIKEQQKINEMSPNTNYKDKPHPKEWDQASKYKMPSIL